MQFWNWREPNWYDVDFYPYSDIISFYNLDKKMGSLEKPEILIASMKYDVGSHF